MNIEEIEKTIAELRVEEKQAHETLSAIKERMLERTMEIFRIKYGVQLGSLVKTPQAPGKIFKVVSLRRSFGFMEKPWLKAVVRKANGDFGTAERHIYGDWEVIP